MTLEPDRESFDAVIVGAGFHGLYLLHRLRQEGFRVHLVEAAPELGGVWYWNCYPGARVDSHIPNYEYSLEEVWRDWTWSEKFPGWRELRAYFRHVDDVLDLTRDISLGTRVTGARFDEAERVWDLATDRDTSLRARHFLLCTGFASKPFVPDLPGIDRFRGPSHHTSRWPQDGLDLGGRSVGVIGTGASGVQVVQEAAAAAERVVVYQRTPVTAIPMRQQRLTPAEHAALKVDYPEIFRIRNAPPGSFYDLSGPRKPSTEASPAERRAVYEAAWAKGGFHFWFGTFNDVLMDEAANREVYEFWRDRTRERIEDPEVAELLAPADPPYPFGTKRPSLEQDYYDVFNADHVDLVDLRVEPIREVTAGGVRTASRHDDLDVLVLATGFDANTGGLTQIDIRATDGTSLAATWADGVDTHLGLAVAGFPNLVFLYGPQSPTAFCNGPTCAELQGEWVVELLQDLRARGRTRIEATDEAQRAWTARLDLMAETTLFHKTDSWYMGANIPGKRRQLLNYLGSDSYFEHLAVCAADGYAGFVTD